VSEGNREFPPDYWSKARYFYWRDPEGKWGVRDSTYDNRIIEMGLDKNDAAAVACILNGDRELARTLLTKGV